MLSSTSSTPIPPSSAHHCHCRSLQLIQRLRGGSQSCSCPAPAKLLVQPGSSWDSSKSRGLAPRMESKARHEDT
ncbi:hypothetical protein Y1Q_0023464 [Alligator mississippiensis]|uniref:Uncharacterized protein n=1 Tax=Alligator mississippiensis TaxID=8496 RepID=A0A151NPR8_ALLMI|nr:hypothetical protein Y1Q_0023464 [Alligator mississippiensis]